MKRGTFSILAVLAVFALAVTGCPDAPGAEETETKPTNTFTLINVLANGEAGISTTNKLYLFFNQVVPGLEKDDITLSGAGAVTAGELTYADGLYTLEISGVKASTNLNVAVAKKGYTIKGSPKKVAIHFKASGPDDKPIEFDTVTADGSATRTTTTLTLKFKNPIEGLTSADVILSGVSGVTKGEPAASADKKTYTMPIGVTEGGTLIVSVNKTGYDIKGGSNNQVTVFFVVPVAFTSLTGNGEEKEVTTTELYLFFSPLIPGLTLTDLDLVGVDGVTMKSVDLTNEAYYTLKLEIADTVTDKGELTVTVKNKTGYAVTGSPKTVDFHFRKIDVLFDDAEADGSDTQTTTKLILTFSEAIDGLTSEDITITPEGVTKGTLTVDSVADAVKYTLPISGFKGLITSTGNDTIGSVTVSVKIADKKGYTIIGSPQTVVIHYFEKTVDFTGLEADGDENTTTTKLTLTFSEAIPLVKGDVQFSGGSGVNVESIDYSQAPKYVLSINNFIATPTGTTFTVEVVKFGYTIVIKEGDTVVTAPKTVQIFYKEKTVTLNSVSANGKIDEETTTALTLTFSDVITGLTADDITVTGENGFNGFTKGALSAVPGDDAVKYTLAITVTAPGKVRIAVDKFGYNITGSPKMGIDLYHIIE